MYVVGGSDGSSELHSVEVFDAEVNAFKDDIYDPSDLITYAPLDSSRMQRMWPCVGKGGQWIT